MRDFMSTQMRHFNELELNSLDTFGEIINERVAAFL